MRSPASWSYLLSSIVNAGHEVEWMRAANGVEFGALGVCRFATDGAMALIVQSSGVAVSEDDSVKVAARAAAGWFKKPTQWWVVRVGDLRSWAAAAGPLDWVNVTGTDQHDWARPGELTLPGGPTLRIDRNRIEGCVVAAAEVAGDRWVRLATNGDTVESGLLALGSGWAACIMPMRRQSAMPTLAFRSSPEIAEEAARG